MSDERQLFAALITNNQQGLNLVLAHLSGPVSRPSGEWKNFVNYSPGFVSGIFIFSEIKLQVILFDKIIIKSNCKHTGTFSYSEGLKNLAHFTGCVVAEG